MERVVMVNDWPSGRVTEPPCSSAPVRILGPCRSCRMAMGRSSRAAAARTRAMVMACSACVPWEKLMRATSIPARMSASMRSALALAGPRVQTILVRRAIMACSSVRALFGEDQQAEAAEDARGHIFVEGEEQLARHPHQPLGQLAGGHLE